MKARFKIHSTILMITGIIAFFWLTYILLQIIVNLAEALNIDRSGFGMNDFLMGAGHLFVLAFHLYALVYIFMHFHHVKELSVLKIILLILGIVSLFSIGVEKVMIDEVAREYRFGMEISEVYFLYSAYLINMIFSALMFFLVLKTFPLIENYDPGREPVEERIFTIAQFMGIISGAMGLLLLFSLSGRNITSGKLIFSIPFFIMFLTPYALAVLYWLSLKLKQRISDWYDEKQLQDIMKASMATLLLSFPGLILFLLIGISNSFYFFLYYVFIALILFSGSTLYFFEIKD